MKITAQEEYGLRCLLQLARHHGQDEWRGMGRGPPLTGDPSHDEEVLMRTGNKAVEELTQQEYKYGFVSDFDTDLAPRGLNEDIVRLISKKKNEPEWLLEWRLSA